MTQQVDDKGLDILFRNARTHNAWQDKPVEDGLLKDVFDLMKMAPTSANCSPVRIIFVKSKEAKERLKPCMAEGNVEKTMAAPVTAILGNDAMFYEHMPFLFPHTDAKAWFEGNQPLIDETAMRNGTLQGAYFILAARSLGLDCGPMSGFDTEKVEKEFFPNASVRVNFLCNLGYGDESGLFPRSPRFDFEQVCEVI